MLWSKKAENCRALRYTKGKFILSLCLAIIIDLHNQEYLGLQKFSFWNLSSRRLGTNVTVFNAPKGSFFMLLFGLTRPF